MGFGKYQKAAFKLTFLFMAFFLYFFHLIFSLFLNYFSSTQDIYNIMELLNCSFWDNQTGEPCSFRRRDMG